MKSFMSMALAVGSMVFLSVCPLAAGEAPQATVGDLVKLIATSKKLKVEDVEKFVAASGFSVSPGTALTERIAADLFGALGVAVKASGDRGIGADRIGRLGALASFVRIEANGSSSDDPNNQGMKTRKGGNEPNSNADVNAFKSMREDPR